MTSMGGAESAPMPQSSAGDVPAPEPPLADAAPGGCARVPLTSSLVDVAPGGCARVPLAASHDFSIYLAKSFDSDGAKN